MRVEILKFNYQLQKLTHYLSILTTSPSYLLGEKPANKSQSICFSFKTALLSHYPQLTVDLSHPKDDYRKATALPTSSLHSLQFILSIVYCLVFLKHYL